MNIHEYRQAVMERDRRFNGAFVYAVRSVARACARNPVAIVIPCHRAVRKDGNLAGYRWGIDRKRKLLEQEADAARLSNPIDGQESH